MPKIGKLLQCKHERGNLEDLYTVNVKKDDTIVGTFHMKNHVWCGISLYIIEF